MCLNLAACGAGNPIEGFMWTADAGSASASSSSIQDQAVQILSSSCTACHGLASGPANTFGLTNVAHLLSSGLIVAGAPDQSPLLQSIEADRMPPGGPLTMADKEVIRRWIAGGAQAPTTTPVLVPPVLSPPSVVSGALEDQAITILQNKCFLCHGTVTSGGLSQINDPAALIAGGWVVPGNAAGSKIYTSIVSGKMPPGGLLNSADIAIIADWINQGAKTPSNAPAPPPSIPLAANFPSINANIIQPKCVACHSATLARDHVRLDTYSNVMRYVRPGSASESKLYKITREGEMPPKKYPMLTSEELSVLATWINAGATQ
jgi:uncharacterized membrane protein